MKKIATLLLIMLVGGSFVAAQEGRFSDSIYVSGKAVVFFAPSWNEYVTLSDEQKDAIDQELYDFVHYRLKVLPYLEANEIQQISTASQNIQVQMEPNAVMTYFRKDFNHAFGLILTDGQKEPQVFLGAATDSEIKSICERYFGLNLPAR